MEHTEYHQLCLWDPEDRILREDFNSDNAKTEAALADLTEAVAGCGNCKIEYGSYTGTGNYSSAHPNSLTFSGQPLLVLVLDDRLGAIAALVQGAPCATLMYPRDNIREMDLIWSGNSVSWNSDSTINQMNASGRLYYYIAFMAKSSNTSGAE